MVHVFHSDNLWFDPRSMSTQADHGGPSSPAIRRRLHGCSFLPKLRMKIILFGASGMVGRACCRVACSMKACGGVLCVGRGPLGQA